ncbi:MAG: hypothetical protein QOF48_3243 [Verrucomicrobiota bacterium]|jgi:hypothetical protein
MGVAAPGTVVLRDAQVAPIGNRLYRGVALRPGKKLD